MDNLSSEGHILFSDAFSKKYFKSFRKTNESSISFVTQKQKVYVSFSAQFEHRFSNYV